MSSTASGGVERYSGVLILLLAPFLVDTILSLVYKKYIKTKDNIMDNVIYANFGQYQTDYIVDDIAKKHKITDVRSLKLYANSLANQGFVEDDISDTIEAIVDFEFYKSSDAVVKNVADIYNYG